MMTNKATDANGNITFKRIDRLYHTPPLHNKVFINIFTCRTTDVHPIAIVSTHNPIDVQVILESDEDDIPFFRDVWRMNTYLATQTEVRKELRLIKNATWDKCKDRDNKTKLKYYIRMKKKCASLLRNHQDKESKKLKKEKEELKDQMEYAAKNSNDTITTATARFHEIEEHESKGAFIRSRCKEIESGSKNTKLHFATATKRHKQSLIRMVVDEDGNETHTHQETSEEVTKYWEHIMRKRDISTPALTEVLNSITKPLSALDKAALGSDVPTHDLETLPKTMLTIQDIYRSINSSPLSKSPGIDGLPIEFYLLLIEDHEDENNCVIAEWLHAVFNYSFHTGLLPEHMRQSQIRLLYKKDTEHDKRYPKNYRPIALLNVDYKILSKVLATKLKTFLPKIVSEDQYAMPNRYIGDLIQLIASTIHYSNHNKLKGFLMFLDFEKAFDSVNHEFTEKILLAHGLPTEFVRWTMLAFTQTRASCIINGKRGRLFELPGGGRQGDNLYPLIFTLAMQSLNSLISTYRPEGITLANGTRFRTKQYADDSTLGGSSMLDYNKYKQATDVFQQASGMIINWDKSILMWLGEFRTSPLILPPGDQITIMRENEKIRVLGVYLGHTQSKNGGWVRLRTAIDKALKNKLLDVGNEIGNTITVNAVLIGSCVFTTQFQTISKSGIETIEKWIKFFIRKNNYITQDAKRYQAKSNGNPSPLLKLSDLIDSLVAKWTYRILATPTIPTYACNWLSEFNAIAKYLQYDSLDQLIMSAKPMPEVTTTNHGFQVFTYYSVKAFKRMGFTRTIPLNWEEIASQPIFDNPRIKNRANDKPLSKSNSPFKLVRSDKLKYLWQLTTFSRSNYTRDPVVTQLGWESTPNLNRKMKHGRQHFNFSHNDWMTLINSIPDSWQEILLHAQGNQRWSNGEFLATVMIDGTIGDVYKYYNNRLHYYTIDTGGVLIDEHDAAAPGTPLPPPATSWPRLSELKRLRTVETHTTEQPDVTRVISFTFQSNSNTEINYSNVFLNSYQHLTLQGPWREMAKEWRGTLHPRHNDTATFARLTFGDPQYDLSTLTSQFNKLLITPKHLETLWKIMNSSLYIGTVGRDYQTRIKHIPLGSPKLFNASCIFSQHQFQPDYYPRFRHSQPRHIAPHL